MKSLSKKQTEHLLTVLKERFEKNMKRHKELEWRIVEERLLKNPASMWSINEMERTGGEPDVISTDKKTSILFIDCAPESPSERRSLCYDEEALAIRKENKPNGSAVGMAELMAVELVNEEQYLILQEVGPFDTKTSSWIKTPVSVRKLGGAIFGDHRFGRTFFYHNSAGSYYSSRGFRCAINLE